MSSLTAQCKVDARQFEPSRRLGLFPLKLEERARGCRSRMTAHCVWGFVWGRHRTASVVICEPPSRSLRLPSRARRTVLGYRTRSWQSWPLGLLDVPRRAGHGRTNLVADAPRPENSDPEGWIAASVDRRLFNAACHAKRMSVLHLGVSEALTPSCQKGFL